MYFTPVGNMYMPAVPPPPAPRSMGSEVIFLNFVGNSKGEILSNEF